MNLTKRRWLVLAASCILNLCIGSLYAWSVFAQPMAEHLSTVTGTVISSLAIVFTVANSVGPISMIAGGAVNDRLGPRGVIILGGTMFGAGMILSGFSSSVPMLLITYGLGVGLGLSFVYGCTVSNTVKFFPDKRGFAGGITTASYGLGSVVVPPIANALNNAVGITAAFKIIGAVIIVVVFLLSRFIIRCPANFAPDGWTPSDAEAITSRPEKNWLQMLTDPVFYSMILMLCCGAFSGMMIISQASPVAQQMIGMSPSSAAIAVSVLAMFNTAGRLLAGALSDKLSSITTLRIFFVLSAAGSCLLAFSGTGDIWKFYSGIAAIGLGFGAIMGIFPGFTAAQFGTKNNSVNYGIMFIGFAAAGFFGPTIMTCIHASQGQYQGAFLVAILLAAVGLLFSAFYVVLAKKQS